MQTPITGSYVRAQSVQPKRWTDAGAIGAAALSELVDQRAARRGAAVVCLALCWLGKHSGCVGQLCRGTHAADFIISFCAIIPLAGLLGDATEQIAMRLGQALGGLLNATGPSGQTS